MVTKRPKLLNKKPAEKIDPFNCFSPDAMFKGKKLRHNIEKAKEKSCCENSWHKSRKSQTKENIA